MEINSQIHFLGKESRHYTSSSSANMAITFFNGFFSSPTKSIGANDRGMKNGSSNWLIMPMAFPVNSIDFVNFFFNNYWKNHQKLFNIKIKIKFLKFSASGKKILDMIHSMLPNYPLHSFLPKQ